MTKSQLVDIVAKRGHLTKRAAENAVNIFFDEMAKALKKGEKVVVSGFGTFYLSQVKDKTVIPFGNTAKKKVVKAHRIVSFKAGRPLKEVVW